MPVTATVPATLTVRPSGSAPRRVTRFWWSIDLVVGDQLDLDAAVGGQLRRVDVGDLLLDHRGEQALGGGQLEHRDVVRRRSRRAPRRSTLAATPPATAVNTWPSFSASGSSGRTSSSTTPPACTFTASGTNSPCSASLTLRATASPALSCASAVEAPRCGVATTLSKANSGDAVHGSLTNTSMPAPADPALGERVGQRLLVDQAAAGGVDDAYARLDGGELLARRSGRASPGSSAGGSR